MSTKPIAAKICFELVKYHQILTSLDGPNDNVMVIKPPMVFSKTEADILLDAFKNVLRELDASSLKSFSHVST